MKVKVKNEMDKINLKVNHQELVLIRESLKAYLEILEIGGKYLNKDEILEKLNNKLFDAHEFKDVNEIKKKIKKMIKKIDKKLSKIYVY